MKALIQFNLDEIYKAVELGYPLGLGFPKEPVIMSLGKAKHVGTPFIYWDEKHRYNKGDGLRQYINGGKIKLFDVIMSVPD